MYIIWISAFNFIEKGKVKNPTRLLKEVSKKGSLTLVALAQKNLSQQVSKVFQDYKNKKDISDNITETDDFSRQPLDYTESMLK